jgi:DNA-directed RNA polymerase specialized sigma24 family protein
MLCHAEGLTQSQIAQRLGLPLGTVKTRMYHGLRALKAALAQRGFNGRPGHCTRGHRRMGTRSPRS